MGEEDIKKEIEEIKSEYIDVKKQVSVLRKQGYDMIHPSLLMLNVPGKIMVAEASLEERDVLKLREKIREILDEAYAVKRYGLNPDYQTLIKQNYLNDLNRHLTAVKAALDFNDIKKAEDEFRNVSTAYKELSKEDKKEVYSRCEKLFSQIRDMRAGKRNELL